MLEDYSLDLLENKQRTENLLFLLKAHYTHLRLCSWRNCFYQLIYNQASIIYVDVHIVYRLHVQ